MKNISVLVFVFLVSLIKSQQISDYKYIIVPSEFNDFKENKSYGLTNLLEKALKAKKYNVLPADQYSWPADAKSNPCAVLSADVLNDKSMFRNKVILQIKDCNGKVLLTEKGNSNIKEFEPGFQDALRQTFLKIPFANPKAETIVLQTEPQTSEKMEAKSNLASSPVSTAQKFANGNQILQKIQIANDQFILVDGNSSVPFATFKSSSKNDAYHVKLSSGESTIGYYENGSIVIDMPKGSDYSKVVFTAK